MYSVAQFGRPGPVPGFTTPAVDTRRPPTDGFPNSPSSAAVTGGPNPSQPTSTTSPSAGGAGAGPMPSPIAYSGITGSMAPERKAVVPSQRIDPSGIPRPRYNMETEPFVFVTKDPATSVAAVLPPPAHSFYAATDTGNCCPRFVRSTMFQLPPTSALLAELHIPLAVLVCPLAELGEHDTQVPLVDCGEEGPLRCSRCKAYVNPFCKFRDAGTTYSCPLCEMVNPVPRPYQCALDQYGYRRDLPERPELTRGSVDFAAPPSYLVRSTPQAPIFVFVVDVSFTAVQNGAVAATVDAISDALEDLPQESTTRVALVTFDDTIHFYDLTGESACVYVSPDVDDVCVPLPDPVWLASLDTSRACLQDVLKRLPDMYSTTRTIHACMGAAVKAVVLGLAELGGRVIVFNSSLPAVGEGKLAAREAIRSYGTPELEMPMYLPEDKGARFYSDLATAAAGRQISIDMFSCGNTFVDLATTSVLCTRTGGQVKHIPGFKRPTAPAQSISAPAAGAHGPPASTASARGTMHDEPLDKHVQAEVNRSQMEAADALSTQFWALFHRNYGFESVMKLRCSTGLRVGEYLGAHCARTGTDADMALVDSDKSLLVTMLHDGAGIKGPTAYLQAALLYTTPHRQRRVRVHTLCLSVSSDIAVLFKHADFESVVNVMMREAARTLVLHPLPQLETDLVRKCVDMLYSYRKHCSASAAPGQLVLPESLKLLPLLVAAMLKIDAFGQNTKPNLGRTFVFDQVSVRADARVAALCRVNTLSACATIPLLYPRLFSLHDMTPEHGTPAYVPPGSSGFGTTPAHGRTSTPQAITRALSRSQSAGSRASRASRKSGSHRSSSSASEYLVIPVVLPPLRWPSADHLCSNGIFLLEGDGAIFLRIGEAPAAHLLMDLMGFSDMARLPAVPELERRESDFSVRVWAVIDYLQSLQEVHRPVLVITPYSPDSLKARFGLLLAEDSCRGAKSYVDLLCAVHSAIQARMLE